MEIKSFIQRRQLLGYFILTYGITWTGIIILLVLKSFNFQAIRMPEILIIFLLMLVGPSTASIILNFVIDCNTKSILIAQLMHASYTGWLFVLSPTASFSQNLLWQSILGISLWVLVLIIFTQTDKRWEK